MCTPHFIDQGKLYDLRRLNNIKKENPSLHTKMGVAFGY